MPPRIFDYTNNFDTELFGATSTSTGASAGLADAPGSQDGDSEYVFFSESEERARLEFNADIGADERVRAFTATMQLDINGTGGTYGNGQPDGVSFNLTRQDALPVSSDYDQGASVGLSVQVMPYSWNGTYGNHLRITWNNQVVGITSLNGTAGVDQEAQPFSISVDRAGNVTASWGPDFLVSGTIPNNEWATVDQTGWDFVMAGRTGGSGGEAYIDDISLNARVACFTRGTMIETDQGPRAVETLQAGDLVWTLDAGHQPIRWIGETRLDAQALARAPQLRPVRIAAGALGNGTPSSDLLVSPQHRVLLKSKIAQRMFGANEVLVAAKQLLAIEGIEQVDVDAVDYVHFLCSAHQIVLSNGALTESMYAGRQALAAVAPAARDEILTLFPEIRDDLDSMEPVRLLVPGSRARQLAQRHAANAQVLMAG